MLWNATVTDSVNKPRGLFLEGLIFGGAYLRREIYVSKSIGLALKLKLNLPFLLCLLCIWGQFSKYKPPGGLYLEGRFNGGFFALPVCGGGGGLYLEGLIHGGRMEGVILRILRYFQPFLRKMFGQKIVSKMTYAFWSLFFNTTDIDVLKKSFSVHWLKLLDLFSQDFLDWGSFTF